MDVDGNIIVGLQSYRPLTVREKLMVQKKNKIYDIQREKELKEEDEEREKERIQLEKQRQMREAEREEVQRKLDNERDRREMDRDQQWHEIEHREKEQGQLKTKRVKLNAGRKLSGANIKKRRHEQRTKISELETDAPRRQIRRTPNNIKSKPRSPGGIRKKVTYKKN